MDLKVKDVAELLSLSESTVRRLASEGRIPTYRIHQQYRFSRIEIQDWMMKEKIEEKRQAPVEEEIVLPKGGSLQYSLFRAIHKGGVIEGISGDHKEEVVQRAVDKIANGLHLDADVLFHLLMDRENLQPTALNHGIAIPHTRDFLLPNHQDVVAVVFLEKPIAYGALDGQLVHTLFFLFASEDKRHLHLLAKIAHFCSQQGHRDLLKSRPPKKLLLEQVRGWEASLCSL